MKLNSRDTVNIFILIDALGWNYIKDRPFLDDIAVTKRPVKSILGFSSGVIPSIFTGKYPQEHKHWSLYFYSPKTSPFKWTKKILWLPGWILRFRLTRKIIEEISKRLMGYTGYFETYLIPIELLCLFDISENKNIYKPKGIRGAASIFDILSDKQIPYGCFTYPLKDKEIFNKIKDGLANSGQSLYFLYLSESDAKLHIDCHNQGKVNQMVDYYEREIKEVFGLAKNRFKDVNLCIFSDHGMAKINKEFDLKSEIERLGFKMPQDYAAFYDSTMARFWFFNQKTKESISRLLKGKTFGKVLEDSEKKELGIDFEDNMYGEVIFLMNTGFVINPSQMGNKAPAGMHGFDIGDSSMDAVLISNKKIDEKIEDVKDFYKIMYDSILNTPYAVRKIKVLYFLNSIVRAGVEEHVLGLLERIDKERFDPILVCPAELVDSMKDDLEKINIRYYPVSIRRWRNIGEIRKFLNILNKEKPDVVHAHLFFATRFAAPLAKFAGIKAVIDTAHLREAWRKGLKKAYAIDRFFYKFVDKVIAVSEAVKDYLIFDKKLPKNKIEVIYNGVDLDKFKPVKIDNNGVFKVGVVGRLEPQKGHKYFLEAVRRLGEDFKDVKFYIVGEGRLRGELEELCRCLGIDKKIEFLGFRKDIKQVMDNFDLLVLPSLYEGLPLVALEAGAMGKPIIVTDVDGSPEVVVNNNTGLVVPPCDSEALRKGMEFFLKQRGLAIEFGNNARRQIEGNFDLNKQVKHTEGLYNKLVFGKMRQG